MDYRNIIKNRELRLKIINLLSFIPDKPYLRLVFFMTTGRMLHYKNPKGFNEKQQWMKIYEPHFDYWKYVDKVTVREIISAKIGEDYLIPLLGAWDSYEEIDFNSLPDQFVLKCNHDSGSTNIVKDKTLLNHKELAKFYNGRLKLNAYVLGRECPYRDVPPKIIAEKLMVDGDKPDIADYKFFCFHGEPKLMYVATSRYTDPRFDFYDMDYNHLDIYNIHHNADVEPPKTPHFEEMKQLATKLSEGFRFVRIDLYEINGKIYFGEYTFFHSGGFELFKPEEVEIELGDWLKINSK